jgi:HK97 family phage major capsid protein
MPTATIDSVRRVRDEARSRAARIIESARTENRALTNVEAAELEGLQADIEAATASIEELASRSQRIDRDPSWAGSGAALGDPPPAPSAPAVLARGDSVAQHLRSRGGSDAREVPGFDLGRLVRGLGTGQWDGAETEQRSMSEGVSANGGITLPTLVSADIIDRARALSRVIEAGAITVPMPNATYRLPRLDTDPAAAWRNELAAIADVTPTMSAADLTARSLACLIRVSVELFEDTPTLGDFLSTALAGAFATEIDRVALIGSGTAPEPRGVLNTAGITTQSNGANGTNALTLRSDWHIDAVAAARSTNFEPTATILHPNLVARMQRNVDSTGQYVPLPAGLPPILHTSAVRTGLTVGTSTDCTEAWTADFTKLAIGVRSQLTVRLLTERYADTNEVALVATMRADIALLRAAAFVRTAGLRIQ